MTTNLPPYRFCSLEEIQERQGLGQVSELEATLETCHLPQPQRVLDPTLAVAKYRRPAAGCTPPEPRSTATLIGTVQHLMDVAASFRSTPRHPQAKVDVVINFVVDRLRSCQSDATRSMGGDIQNGNDNDGSFLPSSWHVQVTRILIWLQFCWDELVVVGRSEATSKDSLIPRTIHTMRSTAYDAYWAVREVECMRRDGIGENDRGRHQALMLDDEMLCYAAISRICSLQQGPSSSTPASSIETSWNGMLLEYTKRRRQTTTMYPVQKPIFAYPYWHRSIQISSKLCRQEYYDLLRNKTQDDDHASLPLLARCMLSSRLFTWRYRTVQQYNVSFAKGEQVDDMDKLLGIEKENWSLEYARAFNVPVSTSDEDEANWDDPPEITVTMKQVAMPDLNHDGNIRTGDQWKDRQHWAYGKRYNKSEPMGLSPEIINRLLQTGSPVRNASVHNSIDKYLYQWQHEHAA